MQDTVTLAPNEAILFDGQRVRFMDGRWECRMIPRVTPSLTVTVAEVA